MSDDLKRQLVELKEANEELTRRLQRALETMARWRQKYQTLSAGAGKGEEK